MLLNLIDLIKEHVSKLKANSFILFFLIVTVFNWIVDIIRRYYIKSTENCRTLNAVDTFDLILILRYT